MKALTILLLLLMIFAVQNTTAQVSTETDSTTQVTEQADSMAITTPYVEPLRNNDLSTYNSGSSKAVEIAGYISGGIGGYMLGYYVGGKLRSPPADMSPALLIGGVGFIGLGITLGFIAQGQKNKALNKTLSFINKYQPGLSYSKNIYGNNTLSFGMRIPIR